MEDFIREMVCVACPLGCALRVTLDGAGNVAAVEGNTCKRGESYARSECTNPLRSFTGTVRLENGPGPLLSVKSAQPVPKAKLLDCAKALKTVRARAPVAVGDVILPDLAGTGIALVATNRAAAT
ncbi:MAG: DUF1667 domain-containing protein [Oscillospiraceae bacterium]|jgi:CxxC motif-containing protein|nr:DUF1667 domain-containing protein [Oscillospiraceae bacterium]